MSKRRLVALYQDAAIASHVELPADLALSDDRVTSAVRKALRARIESAYGARETTAVRCLSASAAAVDSSLTVANAAESGTWSRFARELRLFDRCCSGRSKTGSLPPLPRSVRTVV